MQLALYQPDIPQNAGALIRIAACFGVPLHIIEPCGFTFTDKQLRRVSMDYGTLAEVQRHVSWHTFHAHARDADSRLILLTTKAAVRHVDFAFNTGDMLLLGQEQAGVPDDVHEAADARVRVAMHADARSLNIAVAGAIVLAEAIRQTGWPPGLA